jgi:hypothetical protein
MGPIRTITTITTITCILTPVVTLVSPEIANQLETTMIVKVAPGSEGSEELALSPEKRPTCQELVRVTPTPPATIII